MSMVSPPREDDFNNEESGDEKVEMSLDDIIKLNRDSMMQSPAKASTPGDNHDPRDNIRRSAASRQSAMRQGRFSEARNRNNNGYHGPPLSRPYPPPMRSRGYNGGRPADVGRRSGLPRRHLAPGDKVNIYEGAAGKLKISVVNDNVKPVPPMQRGPPPPPPMGRGRMSYGGPNEYRGGGPSDYRGGGPRYSDEDDFDYHGGGRMEVHLPPKMDPPPMRHRTLDSLFARIKEERELRMKHNQLPYGPPEGAFRAPPLHLRRRGP